MTFDIAIPSDVPVDIADALRKKERAHGRELWKAGVMKRIWRIPGKWGAIVLYRTESTTALHAMLESLPLYPYMKIDVQPLAQHPFEIEESDIVNL